MHICYDEYGVRNVAEFCWECFNKINETKESKCRYILSWDKDLCEVCNLYKHVVVRERRWSCLQKDVKDLILYIREKRAKDG